MPHAAAREDVLRADGEAVTVYFPPALAVSADEILWMVPRLKQDLAARFGRPFPGPVTIYLIDDADLFARMIGRPYFSAYVRPDAGVVVIDHTKMNPGPLTLETTLKHELCHLLLHRSIPPPHLPRWLDEGVAQWYSDGFSELLAADGGEGLRRAVLSDAVPTLDEVNGDFALDRTRVMLAYEASRSAVDYLIREYGVAGLLGLLEALGGGATLDAAFPEALGVSPGEFEAGWRRTLVKTDAWWVVGSIHLYDLLFFMAAVITCVAFLRLLVRKKRYADDAADENTGE